MNFKSLPQLLDHLKDEETAIKYYENIRWNGKPVCPHCSIDKAPYVTKVGYKCSDSDCGMKFSVRVGTIFYRSPIKMRIWMAAFFLVTSHKKGISSVQLGLDLGVTQKTAWFMIHRIRETFKEKQPVVLGADNVVEADETHIGGKEKNKHTLKKRSDDNKDLTNEGLPYEPKKVVIGLIEKDGGKVVLQYIDSASGPNAEEFILKNVVEEATLHTDDSPIYNGIMDKHLTVTHSSNIFVDGDIHTNTIENFWSVMKRGLYGVYHQVSGKYLPAYLNEYAGRFNTRLMETEERMVKFLKEGGERYLSRIELVNR
ncbi:MAG: IS1595 family transposase [Bacteroidetes bacterium]|nr:IS1595 family transposase [Bacteroidota bacterium]